MATKFGTLAERIIGSVHEFVEDGTNIGTVELPVLASPTHAPDVDEDADWADYFMGRNTKAAYAPVKGTREITYFSKELKRYMTDSEEYIKQDGFDLTMVDYPAWLFDTLMYGLASPIVAATPQQIFNTSKRQKRGWHRCTRYDTDTGLILCRACFHARLKIGTAPDDSVDRGSPVWRIEHLGDAPVSLETIEFNPEE